MSCYRIFFMWLFLPIIFRFRQLSQDVNKVLRRDLTRGHDIQAHRVFQKRSLQKFSKNVFWQEEKCRKYAVTLYHAREYWKTIWKINWKMSDEIPCIIKAVLSIVANLIKKCRLKRPFSYPKLRSSSAHQMLHRIFVCWAGYYLFWP
jgi:hypothetical protein